MDSFTTLMAWVQTNLINIHVPKGKKRVTVDDVLPKDIRKRRGKRNTVVATSMEELRAIQRDREDREANAEYWPSKEGQRMQLLLFGEVQELPEIEEEVEGEVVEE